MNGPKPPRDLRIAAFSRAPVRPGAVNHAATVWADMVAVALESDDDPKTLGSLAAALGASVTSVKNRCRLAGVGAKYTVDLGRILRACRLSRDVGGCPTDFLDVAEPRTFMRLLGRFGFSGLSLSDLSVLALIDRLAPHLPDRALRALLAKVGAREQEPQSAGFPPSRRPVGASV